MLKPIVYGAAILLGSMLVSNPVLSQVPPFQIAQRVFCNVTRIRTGQLAVRYSPGGSSKAGLNNGDLVRLLRVNGNWAYIRIVDGPNRSLNGVTGWVNSDYLNCYSE